MSAAASRHGGRMSLRSCGLHRGARNGTTPCTAQARAFLPP